MRIARLGGVRRLRLGRCRRVSSRFATSVYATKIAFGALVAYRMRTFLTALGILIGVSTVIAIDGIVEGLNTAFRDQISMIGTGTLYVTRRPWVVFNDWWKYRQRPDITRGEANCLNERLGGVEAVVPFVHHRGILKVGRSQVAGIRVIGSTDLWGMMSGLEPSQGRFLTDSEVELAQPVTVVGAELTELLAAEGIDIGDHIKFAGRRLRVVGEMPSRGATFGISQDDFIVVPLTFFERVLGSQRSLTLGVVVEPERVERATDDIQAGMRVCRALDPTAEDNFSVNSQDLLVEIYEKLTKSLFATAVGLGFITLVVGGVGIMNIMLVAVAERTKEIGIRKALGARPAVILTQFVVEAAMVSGLGGLLGTILGVVAARMVARFSPLPASVPPSTMLFGVAFGVFVGVVFGMLPAIRASRLTPVDALRSE